MGKIIDLVLGLVAYVCVATVITLAPGVRYALGSGTDSKIRTSVQAVFGLWHCSACDVNASFLLNGLAHRVAFFYAPKIIGGRDARKAVAGDGVARVADAIKLHDVEWRRVGPESTW